MIALLGSDFFSGDSRNLIHKVSCMIADLILTIVRCSTEEQTTSGHWMFETSKVMVGPLTEPADYTLDSGPSVAATGRWSNWVSQHRCRLPLVAPGTCLTIGPRLIMVQLKMIDYAVVD